MESPEESNVMPGLLKINDCGSYLTEDGKEIQHLAFDISDLLTLVEGEGATWIWALFPMGEPTEIFGDEVLFQGKNVWEIGAQVNKFENGILLSWEKLRTFASAVHHTEWGTYIACAEESSFSRLKALYLDDWRYVDRATEEYYRIVEVVFQAVDGCYWLVYAKDDIILHRITSAFSEVETLRTW